ncbi:ABC-type bacteriocin/lantibiotic exporter with double-glycine peptidase domain [Rheinheimera pacifica]|uniref:hypothetical protein n=1 Tax=Rheinheimera pacifica TaxID=173990 RepID=UPI002857ED69|nr:hypothetical protein [Rheinheimera pacifica]MDR6982246.1 ABC-type bacteriocin/lantibiotic exporter with double-glycine peptidase domain [Rheinheimera pacifica]
MKKMHLLSVLLMSLILVGCFELALNYGSESRREQAPPEITGGSGGGETIVTEKVTGSARLCVPSCQKPSKEEVEDKVRSFNVVLQQTNTYSNPVNQKVLVEVLNANNVVASQVFGAVVVGNQIRIANPVQAADWLYDAVDNGTSVQMSIYLASSGFGSEVVTAQFRDGSRVLTATSFLVEIDCGADHPWNAPEQGCVIIP